MDKRLTHSRYLQTDNQLLRWWRPRLYIRAHQQAHMHNKLAPRLTSYPKVGGAQDTRWWWDCMLGGRVVIIVTPATNPSIHSASSTTPRTRDESSGLKRIEKIEESNDSRMGREQMIGSGKTVPCMKAHESCRHHEMCVHAEQGSYLDLRRSRGKMLCMGQRGNEGSWVAERRTVVRSSLCLMIAWFLEAA